MEGQMAACAKNVQENYNKQVMSEASYTKNLNRCAVQIAKQEDARMDAGERGFM